MQKSSAAFPCRQEFLALMKETGSFTEMNYTVLTGGIAYIYQATVR
ncbi:MAG: hypothetical protein ACXVB1_12855 [Pseudobdellovibrionaceae bacterium]